MERNSPLMLGGFLFLAIFCLLPSSRPPKHFLRLPPSSGSRRRGFQASSRRGSQLSKLFVAVMASARQRRRRQRRLQPGCEHCSAPLGWGGHRRPSILRRAALRDSRSSCCGLCGCGGGSGCSCAALAAGGAALGPSSARPALTSPFPTPSLPSSPTLGVPSEPPAPIQPATAPSSGSRLLGRAALAAAGGCWGKRGPKAICGRGGESQAA